MTGITVRPLWSCLPVNLQKTRADVPLYECECSVSDGTIYSCIREQALGGVSVHLSDLLSFLCGVQSYVRARALAVAGSSTVADRLGVPSEAVVEAFAFAFGSMSTQSSDNASQPELELVFQHECLCAPPAASQCVIHVHSLQALLIL